MTMSRLSTSLLAAAAALAPGVMATAYQNPMLPGWHSDPSCVSVPEWDHTVFCTTSSFMAIPGNPVYASQDLVSWKLASHALSRASQLSQIRTTTDLLFGNFASTIRYHQGTFYLITTWATYDNPTVVFAMYTTTDPYDDAKWSDTIWITSPPQAKPFTYSIDPDIFFDDDGSFIIASSAQPANIASRYDPKTGTMSEPWELWNGTTGVNPEGPHLYRKDGYYYLILAEGGTEIAHQATVARSKSLHGPWESAPHNPLVTGNGTNNYFQQVGHADLFQDRNGNWWGVALAVRGGPAYYKDLFWPMGRETALFPVSWPEGGWPTAVQQVFGQMDGPLPAPVGPVPKAPGHVVGANDVYDFQPGSKMPSNLVHWRAPFHEDDYLVSAPGHPNALQLRASYANLTAGFAGFNGSLYGQTGIFRRQEHTYFKFSADLQLGFGKQINDEFGVSHFTTPNQHVDVGIVYLPPTKKNCNSKKPVPQIRIRAMSVRYMPIPEPQIFDVPEPWLKAGAIRIVVTAKNETHNDIYAGPATSTPAPSGKEQDKDMKLMYTYTTALVAGSGTASGSILGTYATINGGTGKSDTHTFNAYVKRWRYTGLAQEIDYNVIVPVKA